MQNHLFSEADIAFLLAPNTWRVVSPFFPPDITPVRNPRHARWAGKHSPLEPDPAIFYILRGKGFREMNGQIYPADAGTVFIYDAGMRRELRYPPWCKPAQHLCVYFVGERIVIRIVDIGIGKRRYREKWSAVFPASQLGIGAPAELFSAIKASPEIPARSVRFNCVGIAALFASFAIGQGFHPTPGKNTQNFPAEVMTEIEQHIRKSLGKKCRLSTLAAMSGYSLHHFFRLFRKKTGKRPGEYINEVRRDALKTMTDSGMRTHAIASALGFSHPSAFIRWRNRQVPS